MRSTMQEHQLLISDILRYGADVYGATRVVTYRPEGSRTATFRQVADNAVRLASGLRELGVGPGDRVGTLAWNTQEQLEAYFAVPGVGAVLHTLNMRLSADQLEHVINQAGDLAVIVDETLVPVLTPLVPRLTTVRHVVVIGDGELPTLPGVDVHRYTDMLTSGDIDFSWPELDERCAAAMCYTSGTTGLPKGVAYSHRSSYLHAMGVCSANTFALWIVIG